MKIGLTPVIINTILFLFCAVFFVKGIIGQASTMYVMIYGIGTVCAAVSLVSCLRKYIAEIKNRNGKDQ